MSQTSVSQDRIAGFIERLRATLRDDEVKGMKPPIERRKLEGFDYGAPAPAKSDLRRGPTRRRPRVRMSAKVSRY